MIRLWLIVDGNYVCHRAFHAMGSLSHGEVPTGVLFGVFNDILKLVERFETTNIAFCFDKGPNRRERIDEEYKATRRKKREERTGEEKKRYQQLYDQMDLLRSDILKRLGINNVFSQRGREADDIIAALSESIPNRQADRGIIVGSDSDLYQCLTSFVSFYNLNKKRLISKSIFSKEWGISPTTWADVKAMAGCKSDDVKGIKGIGDKTAIKFLQGKLKPDSVAHRAIVKGTKIWKRNLPLVLLPFDGTRTPTFRPNEITNKKWNAIMREFGMTSLLRRALGV